MTVKEVFELRKQGKIEEAYEVIRPMYAVHQGKYTTLCMFWTASDILKKRIKEQRTDEAVKIFKALLRILPNIEDKDGRSLSSILYAAVTLAKEVKVASKREQNQVRLDSAEREQARPKVKAFSMLDFLSQIEVGRLSDDDWKSVTAPAVGSTPSHPVPSVAQQLLTCAFHEIQDEPTVERALAVMPLLQEAMRRSPRNKNNQRYMAVVYTIMGERDKAVAIYRQLLQRHHDSWLYAELADLTDDPGRKAALLCRAIQNQRQEQFRSGYRLALARLLMERDKPRAAYELQKCIATRKAQGYGDGLTRDIRPMLQQLQGVTPATDAEQQDFYRRMAEKFGE